jgi:hypothetical protein
MTARRKFGDSSCAFVVPPVTRSRGRAFDATADARSPNAPSRAALPSPLPSTEPNVGPIASRSAASAVAPSLPIRSRNCLSVPVK